MAATTDTQTGVEWAETLDRLNRFVASRVGDRQTAEDITHDVIVRSIAAGALERVDNPIAWLFRSATNAVIDHHRARRPPEPLDDEVVMARAARPAVDGALDSAPGEGADDTVEQLTRCVQPMVARLDPIYRDAITWIDLDGRPQHEAAAAAGVSLSGMKSRVQRARRQLKGLITACCEVDVDRRGTPIDARPRTACGCARP